MSDVGTYVEMVNAWIQTYLIQDGNAGFLDIYVAVSATWACLVP